MKRFTTMRQLPLLALTLTLLFSACVPSTGAYMWPKGDADLNIQCYTMTTGSTPVYAASSCTGSKTGTIYGTDRITLLSACGDAVEVSYPLDRSGSKTGWINASALSFGDLNNSFFLRMKAGGRVPLYRRADGGEQIGTVFQGDEVFLVAAEQDHESGRAQIIMPVSGGWKMGWVKFSDVDQTTWRAIGGGQAIQNGYYYIWVSDTHRLDGGGGSDATDIHVWEALNVPQQRVMIFYLENGLYSIIFTHNNQYLDKQGGGTDPSTLQTYPCNGSLAQRYFIVDLGNGRYELFESGSGLAMDVDHYQTRTNGTDIGTWRYNGQSVCLERYDSPQMKNTQPSSASGGSHSSPSTPTSNNFERLIAEGEKYLDRKYVWGGSTPSTGFDCSGFVCWVYTQSGVYHLPRTTAQSIYNQCTPVSSANARPGDLVFFTRTYKTSNPVTHVGIYVGSNTMLHYVDPIQYAKFDSDYWRSHFYGYGRLV